MKYVTLTLELPEDLQGHRAIFNQMRIGDSPITGTKVIAFAAGDAIGELIELQEKFGV